MASNAFDGRQEIYNRLLKDRIVFLGTDVNDDVANFISAQMLYLEGEDATRDIWLYINSPGGVVTAGMAGTAVFFTARALGFRNDAELWIMSCCIGLVSCETARHAVRCVSVSARRSP